MEIKACMYVGGPIDGGGVDFGDRFGGGSRVSLSLSCTWQVRPDPF